MSANNMTIIKVPFRMSESDLTYVRGLGLDAVPNSGVKRINKHGAAAVERLACEHVVLKKFIDVCGNGAVLMDVYSNAARMQESIGYLGLNIQLLHLIPNIVPNDRSRQLKADSLGIRYYPVTLADYAQDTPIDALNFTHALYYEEPEKLVEHMVRLGVYHAFSTHHNFTQASARLCNKTVAYHYTGNASIRCQADGDDHVYEHGAMHWLFRDFINVTIEGKPYHLHWYVLEKIGDTLVYHFELLSGNAVNVNTPPVLDITDTAHEDVSPIGHSLAFATTLNRELRSPTTELAYVPVTGAVFFYGLFGLEMGNGEFIPLPRGLVGSLALAATGQVRTPALYQLLLARAKNALPNLNYPADMAPKAAIYATVCALILHVEFETVALGTPLRVFRRLFHLHSRVLDFEPAYVLGLKAVAATTTVAISTLVPLHYYGWDYTLLGLGKLAVLGTIAHPFIAVPAFVCASACGWSHYQSVVSHRSAEAEQWKSFRSNLMPGPTGRTLHFAKPPSFTPASVPKRTSTDLRAGCKIKIHADNHQPDVKALERRGLVCHGIAIQESTPSYVAKTFTNALQGLTSRSLAPLDAQPVPLAWFKIFAKTMGNKGYEGSIMNRFILGELRNLNAGTDEIWVSRFPKATRENLLKARDSLLTEPLCEKDLRLSGIVKQEKTGTITIAGVAPSADTRMVMACTPRANWYFGRRMWCQGNVYKKRFPVNFKAWISWDSGASGEEVGKWLLDGITTFSRPGRPARVIVFDRRRFEKNQERFSMILKSLVLRGAGAPPEFVQMNRKLHCLKGAIQGMPITFESEDPSQVSGSNMTAWGGFVVNTAGVVHSLGEPGETTYAALIKGDDGMLVLHPDLEVSWDSFVETSDEIGLPVSGCMTTSLAEIEFASNIPYPTADGIVFGPKIGRTLQRFGWTISNAPPDVYGAATSLLETTHHIPFLRQFIEAHRRLGVASDADSNPFRYKMLATDMHEACPETYAFIEERYGLNASLERHFEELLSTVTCLPAAISWPLIDTLVERDE